MSESHVKFTAGLCGEHLDEAAFLYAQRRRIVASASIPWTAAHAFEQRLEAHLEALRIDAGPALDLCRKRVDGSDPGALYAAARLFFRFGKTDLITALMNGLDPDNEKKARAVVNALVDQGADHPERLAAVLADPATPAAVSAETAANARLKDAWPMAKRLIDQGPRVLAAVSRLAGRLFRQEAEKMLSAALDHDSAAVSCEAATALLRLGKTREVLHWCRSKRKNPLAAGLAGGPSEARFLSRQAEDGPVTRDLLIALGLMGEISAVPVLISLLEHQEQSDWAALSLDLITGAGLEENHFTPDAQASGQTPGACVARLSRRPDDWRGWLKENGHRFVPGNRYRNGKPYGPRSLVETMESENRPALIRQLAYEELVIRYRIDLAFDVNRFVAIQNRVLAQYNALLNETRSGCDDGRWCAAGVPIL